MSKYPIFLKLYFETFIYLLFLKGRSINIKSAGIIGRNGPQSKQPFLVAFFKASGVLLRSVRAAGGKKKNHNRNKSTSQQESSRAPKPGGKCNLMTQLRCDDNSFNLLFYPGHIRSLNQTETTRPSFHHIVHPFFRITNLISCSKAHPQSLDRLSINMKLNTFAVHLSQFVVICLPLPQYCGV